tara:strand:+ start:50 stop:493 length:444 start_codon:yes stop_codon:yes gene_type:complete
MATRATIAKLDDKGVLAIYSHSDNYLAHTGKILDQHYQDESKVDELLSHGDVSIINENIGVKLDFMDFKSFHKNKQCRFYGRDRGEDRKAETLKDETELLEFAFEQCGADLVYMYAYGSWYVYDNSNEIGDSSYQFIELEEALYVRI